VEHMQGVDCIDEDDIQFCVDHHQKTRHQMHELALSFSKRVLEQPQKPCALKADGTPKMHVTPVAVDALRRADQRNEKLRTQVLEKKVIFQWIR
jgi:hypothetical protein